MGYLARLNPRSTDGRKAWPWVERARLEVAPISTLLVTWLRMVWRRHG